MSQKKNAAATSGKPKQGGSPSGRRVSGKSIALSAALILILAASGLWIMGRGAEGGVREIDNRELARLIESGVKVVDIREPWEWEQTGVIEGSHLITAFDAQGRIQPDFAPRFTSLVEPGEEVVLICRTGNRSGVLAPLLAEQLGYSRIRNVTQGILPWIQSGGRVAGCRIENGMPVC